MGVPEMPESSLGENEKRWSRAGVAAYEFDLRYETAWFSWEGRVRVEDGVASVADGEEPARAHILMTIDEYFDYIGDALAEGKVSSAAYDAEFGHPIFFTRDWHLTFFDGPGERFWISGFAEAGTKKAAP